MAVPSTTAEVVALDPNGLANMLTGLGLEKFADVFKEGYIDGAAFMHLTEDEFKVDLGIPLGPRKKLLSFRAGLDGGPGANTATSQFLGAFDSAAGGPPPFNTVPAVGMMGTPDYLEGLESLEAAAAEVDIAADFNLMSGPPPMSGMGSMPPGGAFPTVSGGQPGMPVGGAFPTVSGGLPPYTSAVAPPPGGAFPTVSFPGKPAGSDSPVPVIVTTRSMAPVGFVSLKQGDTLSDARALIDDNVVDLPANWLFVNPSGQVIQGEATTDAKSLGLALAVKPVTPKEMAQFKASEPAPPRPGQTQISVIITTRGNASIGAIKVGPSTTLKAARELIDDELVDLPARWVFIDNDDDIVRGEGGEMATDYRPIRIKPLSGAEYRDFKEMETNMDSNVLPPVVKEESAEIRADKQRMKDMAPNINVISFSQPGAQPQLVVGAPGVGSLDPHDNLASWLSKKSTIPDPERFNLAIGVCKGLAHLHQHQIAHRRLVMDQIWVSPSVGGPFSLPEAGPERFDEKGWERTDMARYLPPEGFSTAPDRSNPSRWTGGDLDLWMLGNVIYEIFNGGDQLFGDKNPIQARQAVIGGEKPIKAKYAKDSVWTIIRQCWNEQPHARLSATRVGAMLQEASKSAGKSSGGSSRGIDEAKVQAEVARARAARAGAGMKLKSSAAQGMQRRAALGSLVMEEKESSGRQAEFLALFKKWGFPRPLDSNNNIMRLQGHGAIFGEKGAEAVAWALKRNLNVVILDISDNAITNLGARHFIKGWQSCTDLRELHIAGNPLREKGAEALADALRPLRLDILNVAKCKLGVNGVRALSKVVASCCKRLLIDQNDIGDGGAELLCKTLHGQNLKSLEMSANAITPEGGKAIGEMLAVNKSLREIHIGQNPLGDQGMVYVMYGLRTNSTLFSLYGMSCEFGDPALGELAQVLATNATLELVDFSGNYCSDMGFNAVAPVLFQGPNQQVVLDVRSCRLSSGLIAQYKRNKRTKVWLA